MPKYIWYSLFCLLLLANSCWSQQISERKIRKAEKRQADYEQVKTLLDSGNFEFVGQWAQPLDIDAVQVAASLPGGEGIFQGNQVNLLGISNFLRITNDEKAAVSLPYFGRAFYADMGNQSSGIAFTGTVTKYERKVDDKKRQASITFDTHDGRNHYSYRLTAQGTNARLTVNGTRIQAISYQGTIRAVQTEE